MGFIILISCLDLRLTTLHVGVHKFPNTFLGVLTTILYDNQVYLMLCIWLLFPYRTMAGFLWLFYVCVRSGRFNNAFASLNYFACFLLFVGGVTKSVCLEPISNAYRHVKIRLRILLFQRVVYSTTFLTCSILNM